MRRHNFALALLFWLAAGVSAHAQSVVQSGTVTPNSVPRWIAPGIIGSGGTASDSPITTFGVTSNSAAGFCVGSARSTAAGRNLLCFGAQTSGAGVISLQNYGTATAQNLNFVINGTTVTLPTGGGTFLTGTGTFTAGNLVKFFNSSGVVEDAGVSLATGTQYGLPYYSAAGAVASTGAATNGQMLVGTTSAAPNWRTLSGDVSSINAAGAVTLQSVNGVTYPSSYTANGVLYASSSSAVTNVGTSNVGYCLLSQGSNSPPIYASCASGSGSAGGSNTQVQFNSSTSLGGSANLTWVSPALTVGVAGTTTGQLALASSTATGTVTLQAPGVSGTYNFNFPTGAGTTGQPIISGGGGATPNTFGTLGVFGGGTNCAAASGTCLDNITAFSSTGYIKRTGSGTYALSSPIPVSDGGTNLASGTSGGILGFTAAGTLASSVALTQYGAVYGGGAGATPVATAAGTNGQVMLATTSAAPAFTTLSGDITTVTNAGVVTIANSAITVAKMANAAGYSLLGNFTASSAAPQVSTIGGLTQKASPGANDLILLQDQAAAGQLKYATVSSVSSAGSVSSIGGNTGAFTLNATSGITNSTNDILCTAGSSSQFGCLKVDDVTILATAGVIGQKATTVTNSLSGNVALSNTGVYFDGPSTAQGTSGTWLATGNVILQDTAGAAQFYCRLWDGTTTIDSNAVAGDVAGRNVPLSLSGVISSPAANIRISCRDLTSTSGNIIFNLTGLSKDSTLTVVRIQ